MHTTNFLRRLQTALLCGILILPGSTGTLHAGDEPAPLLHATEPDIHPMLLWFATQLVPSPEWTFTSTDGARFGLRWQCTPVLYSFGLNKRLSPWRWFVVEPFTRQSGSIELYFTPEYARLSDAGGSQWIFRSGIREYLPLLEHGEYLSASAACSYVVSGHKDGIGYEAGFYTFAGIAGVQLSYTPMLTKAPWSVVLRLRYF
jgi:hypothetical protein